MKLTFAQSFEQWLDPILDSMWHNVPRIISGPLMMIGIIIEGLVFILQLILSLFVFPGKKKKKNPLSANFLEDDNE